MKKPDNDASPSGQTNSCPQECLRVGTTSFPSVRTTDVRHRSGFLQERNCPTEPLCISTNRQRAVEPRPQRSNAALRPKLKDVQTLPICSLPQLHLGFQVKSPRKKNGAYTEVFGTGPKSIRNCIVMCRSSAGQESLASLDQPFTAGTTGHRRYTSGQRHPL